MGSALAKIAILLAAAVSIFAPWIGVVVAHIVSVMTPQDIWWWDFGGLRPSFDVSVPVLIGFGLAILQGKVSLGELKTPLNKMVALLWLLFTTSFLFGPYVDVVNRWRFFDPTATFETVSKILLMYFVGAALLDNTRKIKYATLVMLITFVYMTYWANAQYYIYHVFGRLHGPRGLDGDGIYYDQNYFAVLFVTGAPFLYFLSKQPRRRAIAVLGLVIILLSWNAIFLTASRGALVALLSVICVFALRARKKYVGLAVILALGLAYWHDGGSIMKKRATTITNYSVSQSAEDRLDAWRAAARMMIAHPFVGVGFASFGQAYPNYSKTHPRIAHDTFFQIGGECGVFAGALYLFLMGATVNRLRKNGNRLSAAIEDPEIRFFYLLNEACFYSLIGFFVCGIFLSLQAYSVWYYLLLMANAALQKSESIRVDESKRIEIGSDAAVYEKFTTA
jgi:probable O-glycosylation ligase (exosortase A-associated)